MTPKRIAELRARLSDYRGDAASTIKECLTEIERLQKVKPAPTVSQVVAAMRDKQIQPTEHAQFALIHSGLFADETLASGWYWVRRSEGEPWEAAQWTGVEWFARTWQGNVVPFKIGTKLPDPDV